MPVSSKEPLVPEVTSSGVWACWETGRNSTKRLKRVKKSLFMYFVLIKDLE
jgi:hypothetical protein